MRQMGAMSQQKNKSIGHLLQFAARVHRGRISTAIRDLGLFPGQEQVLFALAARDDLTVGGLARELQVRPPTISKTIQRLAQQHLVQRVDHESDARRATIVLTREGRRCIEDLTQRVDSVEDILASQFDAKETRRLRKLLKRAAKGLATDSGDDPSAEIAEDADEG